MNSIEFSNEEKQALLNIYFGVNNIADAKKTEFYKCRFNPNMKATDIYNSLFLAYSLKANANVINQYKHKLRLKDVNADVRRITQVKNNKKRINGDIRRIGQFKNNKKRINEELKNRRVRNFSTTYSFIRIYFDDPQEREYTMTDNLNFEVVYKSIEKSFFNALIGKEWFWKNGKLNFVDTYVHDTLVDYAPFEEISYADDLTSISDIPLYLGNPYTASCLTHSNGIDEISYTETNNECVITALSKHWKGIINKETLTKDLNEISKDIYKDNCKDGDRYKYTSQVILQYCIKKNITCLGLDGRDNSIVKNSQDKDRKQNNKIKSIYFYAFMAHFYIITDRVVIKHLSEKYKTTNKYINNKEESIKKYKKNEFINDDYEYINESQSIELLKEKVKLQNLNYIMTTKNFNNVLEYYIKLTNDIPTVKFSSLMNISYFKDKNGNTYQMNKDNVLNWEYLEHICIQNEIVFNNQNIGEILLRLQNKFYTKKREVITEEIKNKLYINKYCVQCKITENLEIDHIIPISKGGTNKIKNLQLLCRDCHKEKSRAEAEDGEYVLKIPHQSNFCISTKKIIDSIEFNKASFSFRYNFNNNDFPIKEIDRIKSRRNNLINEEYQFCVYSCLDNIELFNQKIITGFYYVNTSNFLPLNGNGWYYSGLVKYCLEQKIIKLIDIQFQFIPSTILPASHFKDFVNHILEVFTYHETIDENKKKIIGKLPINSLVGVFGRRDSEYVVSQSCAKNSKDEINAYKSKIGKSIEFKIEDTNFCSINGYGNIKSLQSYYPIYAQILDIENLELHKMTQMLKNNDYEVLAVKTDAVLYRKTREEQEDHYDVTDYKYKDGTNKMKNEEKEPKLPTENRTFETDLNNAKKMRRQKKFYNIEKYETITDFKTNDDWDELSDKIIKSNKGCLILGSAGVGKSSLINRINEKLKLIHKDYEIVVLSPTNKSAIIVNGQTLDLFCNLNKLKKTASKTSNIIKYVFVDEISMMKECFYQELLNYKFSNSNIKFILSGDFYQLCPVNDQIQKGQNFKRLLKKYRKETALYEYSKAIYELVDGVKITLTECKRSNTDLYDINENVKVGKKVDISRFKDDRTSYKNLAFTNQKCREINLKCSENFINEHNYSYNEIKEYQYDKNSINYKLSIGMPVICKKNNKKLNIINNASYEVLSIESNEIILKIEDEVRPIPLNEFNIYFGLAFCITIHKSQGETYDEHYVIHEWNKMKWNNSLKYVAMSRATKIEYISIYDE